MTRLPLRLDSETEAKIAARVESIMDGALLQVRFVFPDVDEGERQRIVSMTALRWAYRVQDELSGIVEPRPTLFEVPRPDEPETPEDVDWASGTPVVDVDDRGKNGGPR